MANASAQPLTDVASIHAELTAQLTASVRWTECVQFMLGQGVKNFVELGSKDVLVGLVKRIDRSAARHNVETPEQLSALLA
jgi:[acyl-carrier-protein] S-malonyltransferase